MKNIFKLTILGARGSIPVSDNKFKSFGGATSCYMVETDSCVIFIDAGTGIINAPDIADEKEIIILLTHPHLDHIMGLPFCRELSKKGRKLTIYGEDREGTNIRTQMDRAFSRPYWPLLIEDYPADVTFKKWEGSLIYKDQGGNVIIDSLEIRHPGGCLSFCISYVSKKIVLLTDYEHGTVGKNGEFADGDVVNFCKNSDLVLYDAQYTQEEYETRKGYGHSTWRSGVDLMEQSGSREMKLIHHDPYHDDRFLMDLEEEIGRYNVHFARQGETCDFSVGESYGEKKRAIH